MADISRTVEIVFGANDQLTPHLHDIDNNLLALGAGLDSISGPAASLRDGILSVDTALAAIAATMTGIAVVSAGNYASSVSEIGALFNATGEEAAQLEGDLLQFSRSSTSSIEDITAASYAAISAGTEWTDVTKVLVQTEALATVGVTSLEASTNLLTGAMAAYGAEASESERYSDALFVTVQNGKTTIDELNSSLGKTAVSAANSNVDIETLGAALATMTIAGINTAESSTSLNALFKELLAPSKELAAALGGMSIESDGLEAVMARLTEVTGGTAREMNALFGSQEAATAALILGNDAAGTFVTTLEAMEEKTGVVAANYDEMAKTFDRVNQNLANNIRATFIDLGLPLLDEYGSAVLALSQIFKEVSFAFDEGAFAPVYDLLEGVFGTVDDTLQSIATNMKEALLGVDYTGLAAALSDLGDALYDAFVRVFGEIDPNSPEDLANGIQKAVNILTSLVNVTRGILDWFDPIFDAIKVAADQVSGLDPQMAASVGRMLQAISAIQDFGLAAASALTVTGEFQVSVVGLFDIVAGASKSLWNGLQVVFDGIVLAAIKMAQGLLGALDTVNFGDVLGDTDGALARLEELGDAVSANLDKNVQEANSSMSQLGKGLQAVGGDAEESANEIKKVGEATKEIKVEAEPAADSLAGLMKKMVTVGLDSKESTRLLGLMNGTLEDTTGVTKKVTTALGETKVTTDEAKEGYAEIRTATEAFFNSVDRGNGVMELIPIGMDKTAAATDKAKTAMEEAKEETDEFRIAMEEIASNERIQNMEFAVNLEIAQLEANAEMAVAAFGSIDAAMASTGDLLGDLFGNLIAADSWWSRSLIEDQIDKENDIRKQAAEDQHLLIEKQIDYFEAQTDKLRSGEALIKIEADGMEPEIEAFMWKILEKLQVRGNLEGNEFLLNMAT